MLWKIEDEHEDEDEKMLFKQASTPHASSANCFEVSSQASVAQRA